MSTAQAIRVLRFGVALLVLLPSIARAQMDAGALRALITDQSAGVIPGARATLIDSASGVAREVISDSEGYVTFTPIQRGTYSLRVTLTGFRTRELKDITVDINERKFLRVSLEPQTVSQNDEVSATSLTLQTEEGSLGQVIRGAVATELPLAGRRHTKLGILLPAPTPP